MEAIEAGAPPPVGLSLEGPRPVRRVTVAFRIILAIPHILYLTLLSFVVFFAAIAAWVAALVLGRMPDGLGNFLGRILQYSTRVYGYMYLVTDRYPPFSLGDADYPVALLLPPRGRLNRAAVLFRLILAVPAFIVVSLVSGGLQVGLLFIWLIVLISGRMPTPVFEAEASFLRYEARLYGWLLMLTSEYPSGLFGDTTPDAGAQVPGPDLPASDVATSVLPPPPPPPPPPMPASGMPLADMPAPGMPAGAPRITRIVLSKAGKRLIVVSLVLGAVVLAGNVVVLIATSGQSSRAAANLDRDYTTVVRDSQHYGAAVQSCGLSGGGPACVHAADKDLAAAVRRFRADLDDERFPASALSNAQQLRDDATQVARILDQMVATSDVNAYRTLALRFQTAVSRMDKDYADLRDILVFGY
jgi:hypothetical protein